MGQRKENTTMVDHHRETLLLGQILGSELSLGLLFGTTQMEPPHQGSKLLVLSAIQSHADTLMSAVREWDEEIQRNAGGTPSADATQAQAAAKRCQEKWDAIAATLAASLQGA